MSAFDHNSATKWVLGAAGAIWFVANFWPASWWLTVTSITVHDAVQGTSPKMTVARTINRSFEATWRVELERETPDGFEFASVAKGENTYGLDSRLPFNLDLDWWTYPKELRPKPGRYRIETCWTIITRPAHPTPLCVTSNTFTIKEN